MKKIYTLLALTISFSMNAQMSDNSSGTSATGTYAVAMGDGTTASGSRSTAMGDNTIASGHSSTSMGYYTTASDYASTVIGQYNSLQVLQQQVQIHLVHQTQHLSLEMVQIPQINRMLLK